MSGSTPGSTRGGSAAPARPRQQGRPTAGLAGPPSAPAAPARAPDLTALDHRHQLRARRSPRWIVAGVLAMVLGGLGAVLLYDGAVTSQQVLRVNSAVARGEPIEAGDLGPVTVGALPGVSVVPAEQLAELVGQVALVDLPAGGLVPAGGIGAPTLAEGSVRMGLSLPAGRLPTSALTPGEPVLLIPVPGPDEAAGSQTDGVVDAVLHSVPATGPDGASSLVDVTVDRADADLVARLAATDRLVLARVA